MYTKAEFESCYHAHFTMVWNLCYTYLHHPGDTEDAVQETFLRLYRSGKRFRDREHEKAWLIVTAGNVCKDELKRKGRQVLALDQLDTYGGQAPEMDETLLALGELPEQYRTVLYLFYYEGLTTKEIGRILKRRDITVRSDLHRGRKLLKARLEEEV